MESKIVFFVARVGVNMPALWILKGNIDSVDIQSYPSWRERMVFGWYVCSRGLRLNTTPVSMDVYRVINYKIHGCFNSMIPNFYLNNEQNFNLLLYLDCIGDAILPLVHGIYKAITMIPS